MVVETTGKETEVSGIGLVNGEYACGRSNFYVTEGENLKKSGSILLLI